MGQDFEHLEFVNDQEREYFCEAKLGEDIAQFLVSEVGRYLHGRAKIQFEEAKQAAIELDHNDKDFPKKFSQVKFEAAVAEKFMTWCADAITSGNNALTQLNNLTDNEG